MRVALLTREYPPHVYGGAGVHVEELSKVLAAHADVDVRAFDGPRAPRAAPAAAPAPAGPPPPRS